MTYPPAPPPAWTTPKPPVKVWDVVMTSILLVLVAVLAMFTSFFGAFLAMASDPCGGSVACDAGLIGAGVLFAMGAPWVILIVAVVVAIVLLVRRRVAFWVTLVAAVLIVVSWFVGAFIATSGVPQ